MRGVIFDIFGGGLSGVLIFRRRFHWLAVMRRSSLHVEKMLCSQL